MVIDNARATAGLKECWKHRLQSLKKELGSEGAPLLEQLLIQQAALCWLKLNLVELSYSNVMTQSITLTLGVFWEKRLSAAQKRFTRACETLPKTFLSDFRHRDEGVALRDDLISSNRRGEVSEH